MDNNLYDKQQKNKMDILLSQINTYRKQYEMYFPLKPREEQILDKRFREEEIYTSNHIEGNSYTLNDTRYLLETGLAVSGKRLKDGIEIINVNKGIEYINYYKGKLTEEFVKETHRIVTKGTLDSEEEEREYKQVKNYIGDITTSSVAHTPIHMTKLINSINSNLEVSPRNDTIAIKTITRFKYNFLAIHPFIDGNGRTVRLIVNYLLKQYNLVPISILPEDKEEYYKVLNNCNKDNYIELTIFLCKVLIKTYQRRIDWLNDYGDD